MEYNHFYSPHSGNSYSGTHSGSNIPVLVDSTVVSDMTTTPLPTTGGSIGTIVSYACSWLPPNTQPKLWTALLGVTGVVIGFAGFRMWEWIDGIRKSQKNKERERSERYEYKYISELDNLLQSTLDDMENPELANVDTIKVGGSVFPLSVFKSFSRNFRKKIVRKAEAAPIVKRVAVPADEFDWVGSYVDDMVPVGASRDPNDGKKVVMRYDPETESFWWYCDNPSVQYKYLETVARKYVCGFNRVDVFVDIRNELKKGDDDLQKRLAVDESPDCLKENDVGMNQKKVYAKFKKYNKKAARTDPTLGGKRMILKAKANRYSYKGKLADYEKLFHSANADANTYHKGDEVIVDEHDTHGCENHTKAVEKVSWSEWKLGNFEGWR